MEVPLLEHGFHTFRRSAATIAFDANASLMAIKCLAYGIVMRFGRIFLTIHPKPFKFLLLFNVWLIHYYNMLAGFGKILCFNLRSWGVRSRLLYTNVIESNKMVVPKSHECSYENSGHIGNRSLMRVERQL